jgi:hypothetical protein
LLQCHPCSFVLCRTSDLPVEQLVRVTENGYTYVYPYPSPDPTPQVPAIVAVGGLAAAAADAHSASDAAPRTASEVVFNDIYGAPCSDLAAERMLAPSLHLRRAAVICTTMVQVSLGWMWTTGCKLTANFWAPDASSEWKSRTRPTESETFRA